LHLHPVFIVLDESFLMILTLVSWVGLIAYEWAEKAYQYKKHSLAQTYQMIGLSIVLSVVTWLILLEQIAELWRIGIVIANFAMILVFLVGLMLMEDEE
jgi:UDP-N-acetylmuramyl pentapeptide phosphotransferase/UDP-N-acetylglucosamine-1-phosphate transferase